MKKELILEDAKDENTLEAVFHDRDMALAGENLDDLISMIRELVQCRFDEGDDRLNWNIRLHFLHGPTLVEAPPTGI